MGNVVDLREKMREKEVVETAETERVEITPPTLEEIVVLNMVNEACEKNEMVGMNVWNGDCWKTFYEKAVKVEAKRLGADPWDVFAVFMAKFHGTEFVYKDGKLVGLQMNERG